MRFYHFRFVTIALLVILFLGAREGYSQVYSLRDTTISSSLVFSKLEIRGNVRFDSNSTFAPTNGALLEFYESGRLVVEGLIPGELLQGLEVTSMSRDCRKCELILKARNRISGLYLNELYLHDVRREVSDSLEKNLGFLQIKNYKNIELANVIVDNIEMIDYRPHELVQKHGAIRFDSCTLISIERSSFANNRSFLEGGAFSVFHCDTIAVYDSDFVSNISIDTMSFNGGVALGGEGSAMYIQQASHFSMTSCLIANSLGTTGALYIQAPSIEILSSVLVNNDADAFVLIGDGENREIKNCSILNNRGYPVVTTGRVKMNNCFVLNNRFLRPPYRATEDRDVFTLLQGEVSYTNSVFFDGCRGCSSTDAVDTAGILSAPIRIDANYVDAVNLSDFYPGPTSWLIDKGDSTGISLTDLDFFGAPRWYGEAPDIGAVEWQGVSSTSSDPSNKFTFSFFPNPTLGNLQISCSEELKEFHIYDITGRVIVSENISSGGNLLSLDLEQLRVGTYFIEVVTNKDERSSSKFLRLD